MKRTLLCLLACAVILVSAQSLASAQGARRGYAVTDMDVCTVVGHRVYRIDLDNPGATIEMGTTNVGQELEGLFSIDNFSVAGRSNLFGVAESPDGSGCGDPSILVDITAAAVNPGGLGFQIGETGVNFGTETGSAWSHLTGIAYAVFADDTAPARTMLTIIDPLWPTATMLSTTFVLHVDGLAVGGDGTLYATDARNTDALYRYNFSLDPNGDGVPEGDWEFIGSLLAEDFNEDSGLGNYRGVGGNETNLYMITEGDGPVLLARLWRISLNPVNPGEATLVGNITFPSSAEVPEDLEGFDIPYLPLVGEQ